MNENAVPNIPMGNILIDTLPVPVEGIEGRYSIALGQPWRVMYAFGGATMAAALRAGITEADRDDLRLVSADATFTQAVPAGNLAAQVEILRQGRNGAQLQVRLWGTDDPTEAVRSDLVVTVVLGKNRPVQANMVGATFPEGLPAPLDCDPRPEPPADSPFAQVWFHHQTDWRQAAGRPIWAPEVEPGEPTITSWFKMIESPLREDGTWEPAVMAVPGDILGPAIISGIGREKGSSYFIVTLQLSMQWFAPLSGEWVAQRTHAHHAGDGFATGVAELWSEDRELVALCTQCAYLQPVEMG